MLCYGRNRMRTVVYDNDGKTIDRYTVIKDNSVYTMSDRPNFPTGVNMYCCEVSEADMNKIKQDKKIKIQDLPKEVQQAIKDR